MKLASNIQSTTGAKSKQQSTLVLRTQDVVFGKGSLISQHPGNLKLLELVRARIVRGRGMTGECAEYIVDEIADCNGRFVELLPGTTLQQAKCVQVSKERAMQKVTYTFQNERKKPIKSLLAAMAGEQPAHKRPKTSTASNGKPAGNKKQKLWMTSDDVTVEDNRYDECIAVDALKPIKGLLALEQLDETKGPNKHSNTSIISAPKRKPGRPRKGKENLRSFARNERTSKDDHIEERIASNELRANDVILGVTGYMSKHCGNQEFMKLVRVLSKVYPQTSCKDAVKLRVAEKLLAAVRSIDPPGRFLLVQDKRSFAVLSDVEATRWVGEIIDKAHMDQFGDDVVVRVQNPSMALPAIYSPVYKDFATPSLESSPIDKLTAAEIMVDLLSVAKEGPPSISPTTISDHLGFGGRTSTPSVNRFHQEMHERFGKQFHENPPGKPSGKVARLGKNTVLRQLDINSPGDSLHGHRFSW